MARYVAKSQILRQQTRTNQTPCCVRFVNAAVFAISQLLRVFLHREQVRIVYTYIHTTVRIVYIYIYIYFNFTSCPKQGERLDTYKKSYNTAKHLTRHNIYMLYIYIIRIFTQLAKTICNRFPHVWSPSSARGSRRSLYAWYISYTCCCTIFYCVHYSFSRYCDANYFHTCATSCKSFQTRPNSYVPVCNLNVWRPITDPHGGGEGVSNESWYNRRGERFLAASSARSLTRGSLADRTTISPVREDER